MSPAQRLPGAGPGRTGAFTALGLAFVAGTAVQLQQPYLWAAGLYQGGLLVALALWFAAFRPVRGRFARMLLSVVAGLLLGLGLAGVRAAWHAQKALDPTLEGPSVQVTGWVAGLPQPGANSLRWVFEVASAERDGQPVTLPPRVLLSWYLPDGAPTPDLRAGDRWRLTVRLRQPHGLANPHGFDRERWLWEQGVGATGQVRTGVRDEPPRRLDSSARYPVAQSRQWVRDRILARVSDPRAAGVLAALVVGDQAAIDRSDWALFRTTGVAHLMSISGLHVTVFAWLATLGLGALWRRLALWRPALVLAWPTPWAAGWGGLCLAAVYAVFSGAGVPAQRTVLMLGTVVMLRLAGRRWPWPVVWLTALVAVLLVDPMALMQAGFWLSFVAVGVLFASDAGARAGRSGFGWRVLIEHALSLVKEQGRLTVALAPLSLLLFGQVSLAGLVANLLAIPWVTLLVTPLALLGMVWPPLWDLAALGVQALSRFLAAVGDTDWAVIYRPVPPWPLALLAVPGGALLVMRLPPWLRAAGLFLVWPVLLWAPSRPPAGQFELLALDVGQGSAVLVRTATGSLLYDTGPRYGPRSDAADLVLLPVLRALGEAPSTVVLSHRDSDHAGGADTLRSAWPGVRWLSSLPGPPEERCQAGQRWIQDGVDFAVLHPAPQHYTEDGQSRLESNAMSCVLHIRSGGVSAVLAGDLDAEQETRLALAHPELRANALLASHHGSASSSSPVWLNTLRPDVVLVQAGYRNRFGHPSPVVIDRYRARGIRWAATPDCGAIRWRSTDPGMLACQREQHRRYWQAWPSAARAEDPFLPPPDRPGD